MKRGELRTSEVSMSDIIAGEIIANSKVGTRVFLNPYYGVVNGATVPWDSLPAARPGAVIRRNTEFKELMASCREREGMWDVNILLTDRKLSDIEAALKGRGLPDYVVKRIIRSLKKKYPKRVILSGAAVCAAEMHGYSVTINKRVD